MKKTVAVLFGGQSTEHEVSIKSAFSVLKNIDYDLFLAIPVKIEKDGTVIQYRTLKEAPKSMESLMIYSGFTEEPLFNLKTSVDLLFSVIHGATGEDGKIQGFCEIAGIPYVGCDVESSVLCMNKVLSKEQLEIHSNVKVVPYVTVFKHNWEADKTSVYKQIKDKIGYPCFVKPARSGSSIGITKAEHFNQLDESIEEALKHDNIILIEKSVKARELEVGVIGNEFLQISEIGEVSYTADFYDYETKYETDDAKNILDPQLPEGLKEEIEQAARDVFKVLRCRDYSRIDFFYDETTQDLYFNEINTSPGFTEKSMFPLLFSKTKSIKSLLTSIFAERLNATKINKRFWEEQENTPWENTNM